MVSLTQKPSPAASVQVPSKGGKSDSSISRHYMIQTFNCVRSQWKFCVKKKEILLIPRSAFAFKGNQFNDKVIMYKVNDLQWFSCQDGQHARCPLDADKIFAKIQRCAVFVCDFTRGNICRRICLPGFYLCLYSFAAWKPGINPITGLKLADIVKQLERRKHRMTKPARIWHEEKNHQITCCHLLQPIPVPHAVINVIQWLFSQTLTVSTL